MKQLDEQDLKILDIRIKEYDKLLGPRVGDFVRFPNDELRRFTHDWDKDIQTTCASKHPCHEDQSFYLGEGYTQFSGSLDKAILKNKLILTNEIKEGHFWFFHHHEVCAYNSVSVSAPCRVFNYVE